MNDLSKLKDDWKETFFLNFEGNGTINLQLEHIMINDELHLQATVDFQASPERKLKIDDELRISLEWGPKDLFYKMRPNRIIIFGDVKWFEFYDVKIGKLNTQVSHLTDPDWLCSQTHLNGDDFDRTNYISEIKFSAAGPDNYIDDRTGRARFKFWRPIRAMLPYNQEIGTDIEQSLYVTFGVFPSEESTDRSLVSYQEWTFITTEMIVTNFFGQITLQPFQNTYYDRIVGIMLFIIYLFSTLWLLGIPPLLQLSSLLFLYDAVLWAFNLYVMLNRSQEQMNAPYYKDMNWSNFIIYPTRRLLISPLIMGSMIAVNLLPIMNIPMNFFFIGCLYLNALGI